MILSGAADCALRIFAKPSKKQIVEDGRLRYHARRILKSIFRLAVGIFRGIPAADLL